MCSGREIFGKSITSCSGKIGIVGGSTPAPGAWSGVAVCAQTVMGTDNRPIIHIAHASLLGFIGAPFNLRAGGKIRVSRVVASAFPPVKKSR
jgi:hypothetical protein